MTVSGIRDVKSSWTADTARDLNVWRAATGRQSVTVVVATIPVGGQTFILDRVGAQMMLTHPQWSLMGCGDTIAEARQDLYSTARDLAELLRDEDRSLLTEEAQNLRAFVLALK